MQAPNPVMTVPEVRKLVLKQIGEAWEETNAHGVDLRSAVVEPRRTRMIDRQVLKGKIKDSLVDVWIVLEELPNGGGYTVFYDDERAEFGLASDGLSEDEHLVICGYYGDFWNAFQGM